MDQIKSWALSELKKHINYLENDELEQMLETMLRKDVITINQELSNLLDFTNRETKKFINSFIERIETQRKYEEEVKKVQAKTNKKMREEGGGTQKATKQIKDVSKFLVPGRQICYCQCTRHNLVNNCTNCGKIVCEQEGEGPCLFCGAWVDRETMYDVGEDRMEYEIALNHRDKLIEYDVNAAQRLGVLDAQSDWYDLANNTWLNKEQRKYALQMQEVEKKRQEEMDSKMNVTIDLQKGTTNLKTDEEDKLFTFGSQNQMTNEYLMNQADKNSQLHQQRKFKPFESDKAGLQDDDPVKQLEKLNTFSFKACKLQDEQSKKLYENLKPDYSKIQLQEKPQPQAKGGKKNQPQDQTKSNKLEQENQDEIIQKAKQRFLESSFSHRLQTENPFDDFKKAVEKAVINKAVQKNKFFEGDKDFFREADDTGMCLSMHQPWASLLIHGFKRFEGRDWTNKYRGPLWIHATSQKPTQEIIDQLEEVYRDFYKSAGEDMPPFPERYPTSCLLGRIDLIDIITIDEYRDTVPEQLQEPTESPYQFICRNPQYLELPMRMSGQPGIYKIEKALFFGVKDLLKKVPFTWWPPQQYRLYQLGRFDLYPLQCASFTKEQILKKLEGKAKGKIDVVKTNMGCFHIKNLISLKEQQTLLDSLRNQCINEPQKYKFTRSETLAEEEQSKENDTFEYFDSPEYKNRNAQKSNCYVMSLNGRDISDEIKFLPQVIEEGVNQIRDPSAAGGIHSKSVYKRFTFDFFKEDGGYMEKIPLSLPQSKGKKKSGGNKLMINSFFLVIGDSVKIDYTIDEENKSYNYSLQMQSGDAFVLNSEVKGFQFAVTEVQPETRPKDLAIREGTLIITAERD